MYLFLACLHLLGITPSEQSVDYVENKKQFQLHTLLTEQRHPKTWNLSDVIQENTQAGIEALLSVDFDISNKFIEIAKDTSLLEQASESIENAILGHKKIYIYGCGATGRLAKQVESAFWRPFWLKIQSLSLWEKLEKHFPDIENLLVGEMTGADRALISSLEGFEDLQLIGKLQLQSHNIQPGDPVFAITEGGETSSVIGTILEAFRLNWVQACDLRFEGVASNIVKCPQITNHKPDPNLKNLYFIYNNPDEVLNPFDRSRTVLENEAITKIPLYTGPQAITGSTRMQATTSETFIMGIILEHALCRVLQRHLSQDELSSLGFDPDTSIKERLLSFLNVQQSVYNLSAEISRLTDMEASTYAKGNFSTYFAGKALITVFTDATERSPTFKLHPLDTVEEITRKSWIQVWTPAKDKCDAWQQFLGRPFKGLNPADYEEPFINEISDPYLQKSALASLKKGGDEQQFLYDFSFSSFNLKKRGPNPGDCGVLILFDDEVEQEVFWEWLKLFADNKANVGVIVVTSNPTPIQLKSFNPIHLNLGDINDPLTIRRHVGLKMLLNAHSTGVMTKLGRVVGNTMVNVNPGNLKLIGRATFMIQMHVNDALPEDDQISYSDANAVLFDAMEYVKKRPNGKQASEVALSIIRILESIRTGTNVSWETAEHLLDEHGLDSYLKDQRTKRP